MRTGLIVLLLVSAISFAGEKPAKKFKVVFTITYNSMTLQEAATVESVMRICYPQVDVELSDTAVTIQKYWPYVKADSIITVPYNTLQLDLRGQLKVQYEN